ncbi:MAG TPA: methyltransferase domain-containing protein [Candidatus Binatia bacterium]|nr:methyltransferase domain-containing protein [Candidatus Binatia bacterium]
MTGAGTQAWLEANLEAGVEATGAPANPIYAPDGRPQNLTAQEYGRLLRKLTIFRWLDRFAMGPYIDVASGWEHLPWLAHERYGVPAFYCDMVHRLTLPFDGLVFGKVDHAVTLRLPVLPFRDGAFDVVTCSEVFEHLERPVEAMAELLRVARRYVVLTTLEGLSPDRWSRRLAHHRVDVRIPHVERNFLTLDEFAAIFGDGFHHERLLRGEAGPVNTFATPAEQAAACRAITDAETLADALCAAVEDGRHGAGAAGIVVVKAKDGAPIAPPRPGADRELARWLIAKAAFEEDFARIVLAVSEAFKQDPSLCPKDPAPDRPVAPELIARLACPDCRDDLAPDGPGLRCTGCARRYASEYGVPILYPSAGTAMSEDECLSRLCGDDARRRQVVRRVMRRLRQNERPPGVLRRAAWRVESALGFGPA